MTVSRKGDRLTIESDRFRVRWDLDTGDPVSLQYDGNEVFAANEEMPAQFSTQAFRAPVDNDRGFGNWLAADWEKNGMSSPATTTESVQWEKLPDNRIRVTTVKRNTYLKGSVVTRSGYTVSADGTIDVQLEFIPTGELPELPRLGVVLMLREDLEYYTWYGRGPHENYPDRKYSSPMGLWQSTVSEQFVNYPFPQENGNKEDIQALTLTDSNGQGIQVNAIDTPFSASALHFLATDLAAAKHSHELEQREETILSIDAKQLGLGNSSCGPGVLQRYAIDKKEHSLRFTISPARAPLWSE